MFHGWWCCVLNLILFSFVIGSQKRVVGSQHTKLFMKHDMAGKYSLVELCTENASQYRIHEYTLLYVLTLLLLSLLGWTTSYNPKKSLDLNTSLPPCVQVCVFAFLVASVCFAACICHTCLCVCMCVCALIFILYRNAIMPCFLNSLSWLRFFINFIVSVGHGNFTLFIYLCLECCCLFLAFGVLCGLQGVCNFCF